jgi:hypothetical protein
MMLPGVYDAQIVQAKLKIFNSGTEAIAIKANVTDGSETLALWGNLFLTDKAIPHTRTALTEMGFDFETRDLLDIDKGALVGVKIKVEVQEENYQGTATLKIGRFGVGLKMEADRVSVIQARLREKKKQADAKPVNTGPQDLNGPPADLDIPEENIPF